MHFLREIKHDCEKGGNNSSCYGFSRLKTGKLYNPELPPIIVLLHNVPEKHPRMLQLFAKHNIIGLPFESVSQEINEILALPQVVAFLVHKDLPDNFLSSGQSRTTNFDRVLTIRNIGKRPVGADVLKQMLISHAIFRLLIYGLLSGERTRIEWVNPARTNSDDIKSRTLRRLTNWFASEEAPEGLSKICSGCALTMFDPNLYYDVDKFSESLKEHLEALLHTR